MNDQETIRIIFYPIFKQITGKTSAALFLSRAWYWKDNPAAQRRDGWFYKSQKEWEQETMLTRTEIETARRICKGLGLMDEKLKGVPATLYYRVNKENIEKTIISVCGKPANWIAENLQTSMRETRKQDYGKPANINKNHKGHNKNSYGKSNFSSKNKKAENREADVIEKLTGKK